MNKPKWRVQDKNVIVETISGLLDLFRFETRGNRFTGNYWMVVINKKTNKVLTEPGSRAHMKFGDSDEAIEEILKLITTGELKI